MKAYILSLTCAVILWPTLGAAELYKWTDDQGNFHITDTPPSFMQKKSSAAVVPAPRSMPSKKTMGRPVMPQPRRAELHPAPVPTVATPSTKDVSVQPPLGGLSPNQATLTSPWKIFEGTQLNAKAPVLHWKDEQGLDHFADVFPMIKDGAEVAARSEHGVVSRATMNAKERATATFRTRHQAAE